MQLDSGGVKLTAVRRLSHSSCSASRSAAMSARSRCDCSSCSCSAAAAFPEAAAALHSRCLSSPPTQECRHRASQGAMKMAHKLSHCTGALACQQT